MEVSEASIICWRHYRIRITRNTKSSLNGREETTIRRSSHSKRSTAYCIEEEGERSDFQVERRTILWAHVQGAHAPDSRTQACRKDTTHLLETY